MAHSPTDWPEVLRLVGEQATEPQRRVLELSAAGYTVTEIGAHMGVTDRVVYRHRGKVLAIAQSLGYQAGHNKSKIAHHTDAPVPMTDRLDIGEEHYLRTQAKALRAANKRLEEELAEANTLLKIADSLSQPKVKPIKINRAKGRHQVAASAFLSDTHFDEVVTLEETGGVNEYDRAIAERRLAAFAEKTVMVSQDLLSGFDIVHLDLLFGGDMVGGNIHEELARTNQAEIMDTVDHWSEKLSEVVLTLSKEFPSVFIPCVVGNHGRNTRKPRHKGRVRDNFDWLIYRNVHRIISGQANNVTMQIAESTDAIWQTLGKTYCLTHGDQASGGQGWGGIFSPIMRLYEKKLKAYAGRGQAFDYLVMGHWHQFIDAGPVIVNGTTKGYDEFAHNLNFRPETPQQAYWLTDPDHGKIFSAPLFVDD